MARDICILLGERIRELRKARSWRQIDLAAEAELNVIYISDLENGRKEVCLRTLQSLATAFDMKITEVLGPIGL
jgi:XRE family aerobic/anaerobic benzoate catabolism transcriptional regulator